MLNITNYQITAEIYTSSKRIVYRGIRLSDQQPVILKCFGIPYPSAAEIAQLKYEYEITKNLNLSGIIKPLALLTDPENPILILEDMGGLSLKKYLNRHLLELSKFLKIAIQLAQTLGELHQQKIIHKDIKPSNIILNPDTFEVRLTDFAIASQLTQENPNLSHPNLLEGSLAYMSPEQTGRMNRSIDYRTDFYSLGVTFYEILTGQLPYESEDVMELVHCHIARIPVPPNQINPQIPPVVSDIIIKLLAKTAEDRYQSGFGLKIDLEKCLKEWQEKGEILEFTLATQDFSGQLQIPQKLYGRERELAQLLVAFERVCSGQTELMLIAGYSGIGKSALVQEIQKPLVRYRGYFISGKFDQFQRNIPYSSLIQAFAELMQQLLTESDQQIQTWKQKILEAVGNNGQVIIDVIPEVELIIGKQPPVPELGATESQNRFSRVFQQFIAVFSIKEHPLVVFLDDLQWADSASLKLIEILITDADSKYLLMIGAYRDNEVSPTHPTIQTIEKICQAGAIVNNILLAPLQLLHVEELITDTLNESVRSKLLSELLFNKTQGNPFFLTQLLKTLYQEELLVYDLYSAAWQWSSVQIQAIGITDYNVVELIARNLRKLPVDTQKVLKLGACIGNTFNLEVLSVVNEESSLVTAAQLMSALQAGLILPLSNEYKIPLAFNQEESSGITLNDVQVDYKFLHDRVQQAAYSLIPDEEKKATHLKIGKLLLESTTLEERKENIFVIVNQLNYGTDLLTDAAEKYELAELNLIAGQKAKAATAYQSAIKYFNVALGLLAADSWNSQYNLTLTLYLEAAETEYFNTNFEQSKQLSDILLKQAKTLLEKVKVYEIKMQYDFAHNQMQSAIDTGINVLEMLGVTLKQELPQGLIIQDLADLPPMTALDKLAAMRILKTIATPAYVANSKLFPPILFTMIALSIAYGNSPESAFGYSWYGVLLCGGIGDIDSGYQVGKIAIALLEKFNAKSFKSSIVCIFNVLIRHWKEPMIKTIESFSYGIQIGLETGDIEFACHNAINFCGYSFFSGIPLEKVAERQSKYIDMAIKLKQDYDIYFIKIYQQVVDNLRGEAPDKYLLNGQSFDREKILTVILEANTEILLFATYVAELMLFYLFKDYTQAVLSANLVSKYPNAGLGLTHEVAYKFYHSLTLLALYPEAQLETKAEYLNQVEANQEKINNWAFHAPCNYQHKYDLVEAEKARILGLREQAIDHYDRAIQGASQQGYIQEEALANELAAQFYLSIGKNKIAKTYMTEAYSGYIRWGAIAKVKDLESEYPDLITREVDAGSPHNETIADSTLSISTSHTNLLDLSTVLKASQAIASEIDLDHLLAKLMKIALENAGAQSGILLLNREGQLLIEAAGTIETDQILVRQSIPVERSDLSFSIINYVARTQEDVVLNEAIGQGNFTKDPYIIAHQTKSILCTPILSQGKLIGILYLENNLMAGAFTQERTQLLKLLCSQAAISLENAQLYEAQKEYAKTLERQVQERTQELQQQKALFDAFFAAANAGFVILDNELRYVQVNEAIAEINGVPAVDHIGRTLWEVIPDLAPILEPIYQKILTTGEPLLNVELSGETASQPGVERHWIVTYFPLSRLDGKPIGVGVVVVEISDRKRTEAALQESERVFRAIFNGALDAMTITDDAAQYVDANPAACQLFGMSKEQLLKAKVSDFNEPGIDFLPIWQNFLVQGQFAGEFRLHRPDGTVRDVEFSATANFLPHRHLSVLRDITERQAALRERQQAEEALRESQRVLSTLMSSLPGIAYRNLYDEHWTMEFVSEGCFQLTGYYPEDLIVNRTISYEQMTHPEDRELVRRTIESAVALKQPFEIVYRIITATGEPKWIWEKGQAVFSASGEPIALEGFITDISDRKQAEDALRQSETKLKQAKEAADAANRAKSEFLSKMSHELRTPLNAILGFTQILARGNSLTLEQQEHLGIINRAGEHLLTLINDVLEMSKIEAGRIELHENSFDLYCLLDSLEEMFKLKAESKGLQLIFNRTSPLPQFIKTDESKLRQILINLLGNAIKFTEKGSVTLRLRAGENIKINTPNPIIFEEQVLHFEVEDTGPGIAPEELTNLFDPFVQTETGKKSQSGTGLGLPISRQFVQLMGGDITLNSSFGQGTTFQFDIPIKQAQAGEIPPSKSIRKVIGLAPNQPTYRILVVDDIWESRFLLFNLLSPLGFQVRQAANGQEAVTICQEWQPHLIWMDMQMPVMDGYEATKQIKSQLGKSTTIIIGLTASAFDENREMVLASGCDDFVSKPFREQVIFEKMAEYLGVRYIYEEPSIQKQTKPSQAENVASCELTTEDLAVMPEKWLGQLYQAASALDDELVTNLIQSIEESHPKLANGIMGLAKKLRFDKIIDLIPQSSLEN